MDIASRLIRFAFLGLVVLVSAGAFAYGSLDKQNIPAGYKYAYISTTWNVSSQAIYGTVAAACEAAGGAIGAAAGAGALGAGSEGFSCYYNMFRNGNFIGTATASVIQVSTPAEQKCPTGSTELSDGTCECALGSRPAAGKCEPYKCPAKGSYQPVTQPDVKMGNAGDSMCDGGCSYTPSQWKVGTDGQIWGVWPFKSGGSQCGGAKQSNGASSGSDSLPPAPVPCGANQCPGQVNGVDVCVPCASNKTQGPSTSASGAQPGDPPKDPNDPKSAVVGSNQETECIGGVCTTTTRFVDGHGNEVGSKSEEQPRDDYCAKNPSSQQCKQSSFGGACQGGFTCEGDAVQCALAREVYQRNCQWFKDPSPEMKAAGDAAVAGGAQPEGHPGKSGQEVEISLAGQLDQLDRLGGGCPTDVSLSVVGHQVVLPFSQMCSSLNMVGQIAVAICLIWAAIIVFKE